MEPEDANVLKEDYDITYYLNGGIPSSDLTYNYIIEELPLTLDIPEKPGYNFAGWYTESSYQNKITEINIDNFGDVSLYAKWTKKIDSSYSVEMYPYSTASQMSGNDRMLKGSKAFRIIRIIRCNHIIIFGNTDTLRTLVVRGCHILCIILFPGGWHSRNIYIIGKAESTIL